MNVRITAACLIGLAIVLEGCASGGAPPGIQPQAQSIADEDLPAWVLDLPEGEPPRDNDYTNEAALFLFQVEGQELPESVENLYRQVLESAQSGIQLDPTNAQSYVQAGQAYLGLGDHAAADEMFDQAEEIYPRSLLETNFFRETEWIQIFNGAVAAMTEDLSSGLAAMELAHVIYQGRPEAMMQLGGMYMEAGRSEEALDVFNQAEDLIEGPIGQREEDPLVLTALQESLEIVRFNQAQILFELERYQESAEVYQELVEEDPNDLMAYSNLGAALVAGGDADGASAVYSDLLARPGLSVTDYNTIAVGAYNGDLFVQAAQAFGRAYEALPQSRDFIFNQVQSLYLAEAWDQLLEVAPRLIELDTHNQNGRRFLVQAFVGLDRMQEAAPILDEMEALPFEISGLLLQPVDGGYVIPGLLTNRNSDAGSTAEIRFRVYDGGGLEIGSQDVSLMLGEVEQSVEFQVDFPTTAEVIGYHYEVLN